MKIAMQTVDHDGGAIDDVQVQVTRFIRVGGLYKITPTEAYLGIESGTVKVTHIAQLHDIVDIGEDVRMQADEFARILLDTLGEDTTIGINEDERMSTQPWVVYQYSKLPEDRYVLPLEEFVIHTTQY